MTMKVYAVYSLETYPSCCMEGLFRTKEGAKKFIEESKKDLSCLHNSFDIQLEEVIE